MGQTPNINSSSPGQQASAGDNTLNELGLDDFLNLMLVQLQNQDPLNPLENDQLLAQISQIREVGATEKLTETLDSVLLGQSITSATNLIGANIDAISDDNQRVSGIVESVSITNGTPKLHLDLGPKARPAEEAGNIGTGTYQYRVVWNDAGGNQVAVDPLAGESGGQGAITLSESDQAILISGLPATAARKSIYRTDGSGTGNFRLVGTLPDGQSSTFLDDTADADLSETVLNGNPPLLDSVQRSFEVSLGNVGEIRPPGSR